MRLPVRGRPDDVLLTHQDAAALIPVLQGTQLLAVHVERASDILQVLALRQEFPAIRLVLVGATEGWRVAPQIAAAHVPVIANALNDLPESFEQISATQSNVGRMRAAGINVAIGMLNDNEARQVRLETQYAGNLVALTRIPGATGLSWNQAFAAISSAPAEALGLGDEIGSLRPGRRADVVIWDGDPLELSTGVVAVWIDGVRQSLSNRQTELRDRYRHPQEGALPHARSEVNPRSARVANRLRAPISDVAPVASGWRRGWVPSGLFAGRRAPDLDDHCLRRATRNFSGLRRSGGGRSRRRSCWRPASS